MIPLLDLKAQYASIGGEIEAAAIGVLRSGRYVLGPDVERLEKSFAAYSGCRQAVAVNSGTSALHLALQATGVGPGDDVITTPFTFVATIAAILYAGARPVLVDIDPVTLTLDPDLIEAALTPATRAIIPVHLHGQMADMAAILSIAERHGLKVIEDACQAHGAEFEGCRAGSLGIAGCFSFYPGKNLGACGEGGMLVTNDLSVAAAVRQLRDWGQDQRYSHVARGFNYRMDAIQGAVLSVKLPHLETWTERRRAHARRYGRLLAGLPMIDLPVERVGRRHVYHIYAIRTRSRARLRQALATGGVETGLHYPIPVHLQPAYADLGYAKGDFPVAEAAAEQVLSLPLYPELEPWQIETVARTIERDVYVH